ncbi:LacI family DNA-binding transcriptional regulator [Actinomadura barringtoniae]|uniref:LacI family DNA-binding transcriptional regulator n=1 Tax=Actinomadura barringtoniae TaxID=1427535 RepID=A0A939P7W6_9ACTN|nr:LacI family DNA-binding transcriptional regulator [Actinomadura barringtoniae]MBO2447507.1 LacI family DNA-binding transcriptional regulator [Actinomadura barringtoniae]
MDDHTPGPRSGRPPTSTDVARAAGVSQATVSYVLNDAPGVRISQETRVKVREAAERLGYAPHASARVLRTGRSDIVLIPTSTIPVGRLVAELDMAMSERLRRLGHTVVHFGDPRSRGVAAARVWAEWRPAAVFVEAHRLTAAAVSQLYAAGVATVLAFGPEPSPYAPTFVFDDGNVGACAAEHLIARGSAALAAVVPTEHGLDGFGLRRLEGVARVARAHDVPVARVDLPFDEERANEIATGWTRDPGARPDGVFAYNDEYAMLLMRALQDAGLDIPGDIAVVGADDLPLAPLLRPRLSSVRVLTDITPDDLAERLAKMIADGERDPATTIRASRTEMIVRESS